MSNFFSRDDDDNNHVNNKRINWLDSFADNYENISKEQKLQSSSYLDQLKSIIDNNYSSPKHATVESKVNEYKERIGLNKLNQLKVIKKASEQVSEDKILLDIPEDLKEKIIIFINNKCKSTEGRLPVAAILDEILSLFSQDGLSTNVLADKNLISYIKNKNDEYKKEINNDFRHLGLDNVSHQEDDGSNSDFFHNFQNIK